jgi:hypothetical protein
MKEEPRLPVKIAGYIVLTAGVILILSILLHWAVVVWQ